MYIHVCTKKASLRYLFPLCPKSKVIFSASSLSQLPLKKIIGYFTNVDTCVTHKYSRLFKLRKLNELFLHC